MLCIALIDSEGFIVFTFFHVAVVSPNVYYEQTPVRIHCFRLRHARAHATIHQQLRYSRHKNDALRLMIRIGARASIRSRSAYKPRALPLIRGFSQSQSRKEDPRLEDLGRRITDDFAVLREHYGI